MDLNYKQFGQGQPIIILHGLFGTLDNWQTIAKELSEEYTVFILDQRNHGRSPHTAAHTYELMAADLKEFMEHHWIYEAHIIGHSMGGKTAMQFALSYPDMVNKLVVVDIAPKAYTGGHQEIFDAMLGLDLDQLETRQEIDEALKTKIPEKGVRLFLMKNLSRIPNGGYQWKLNLPVIYEYYQDILKNIESEETFEKPSLFIKGAKSDYIQNIDVLDIQEQFLNAQFETIEKAGHWVHAENPDDFLRTLNRFLKQ